MNSESILACVRIKPLDAYEGEKVCVAIDDKSLILMKTNEKF